MPVLKFSASAVAESGTKTIVTTRGFSIIVDEPESLGGTDAGANPVEYMLAALAGCLNVVGHVVAAEMGFTLRGLDISLEGDLDPAKFLGQPSQGRAGYTGIKVAMKPDADAEAATLDQWLKTVESRCPVSDNITNATPVFLTLA